MKSNNPFRFFFKEFENGDNFTLYFTKFVLAYTRCIPLTLFVVVVVDFQLGLSTLSPRQAVLLYFILGWCRQSVNGQNKFSKIQCVLKAYKLDIYYP